jgi:hypothetical protein
VKDTPANPADLDAQLAAFKSETPAGMDDALEQYKASAAEETAAVDETDDASGAATEVAA